MNVILDKQDLEEFIESNKIECFSVIIKVDTENKTATYIIDGEKIINAEYEKVLKYFL